MSSPNSITRFFRACEPNESLPPDDPRYVNCDDVRGENLMQILERGIRRADPAKPEMQIFTGHRGVGKTSELLRLRKMLEKPAEGRPFQVIYFDVSKALDTNDLEFPDLLVFTAAEVHRQLQAAGVTGFSSFAAYLGRVWDDIKNALGSEIAVTGAEVDIPYATLAVELRNRPNSRSQLRNAIEAQSTNLLAAVNELLDKANTALRENDSEGLVLIIDGLDKLTFRMIDDGKSNTHIRLFCDRADQLSALKAHTVYTVPISLIYSERFTQLEQCFGEFNVPIPMIRIRGSDRSEVTTDTPGMKKLWEMIDARCRFSRVKIDDVFDSPETGHYLCRMTGGHPRHLMMFLQASANAVDDFPITKSAAERAVRNYSNSLLREIPDEFWDKIIKYGSPQTDIPKDEIHEEMLFLLHVFEYMDDQPWYEVNPAIRILPKFTNAR